MKPELKKYLIVILAILGCVGLLGLSTPVSEGLRKMLNQYGLFDKILWSNGRTTLYSDIGTGNALYPISLSDGTSTIGVLPENQGGRGTNTAQVAKINQTGGTSSDTIITNGEFVNATFSGTTTFPANEITSGTKTTTMAASSDYKIMMNGGAFRVSGDIVGSNTPRILFKLSAPIQLSIGTTTATVVGTWTIPGGTLDTDSGLQFYLGGTATQSSSALYRILIGSQQIYTQNMTTNISNMVFPYFQNTGSLSVNMFGLDNNFSFLQNNDKINVSTVDTSADVNVTLLLAGTGTTEVDWFRCILEP